MQHPEVSGVLRHIYIYVVQQLRVIECYISTMFTVLEWQRNLEKYAEVGKHNSVRETRMALINRLISVASVLYVCQNFCSLSPVCMSEFCTLSPVCMSEFLRLFPQL